MDTKQKKRRFTKEEKVQAVMRYREIRNLSLVASEVGVGRRILRQWVSEYGDAIATDPVAIQVVRQAVIDASNARETFLKRHYDGLSEVISLATDKIRERLDSDEKLPLPTLITAIRDLSQVIKDFTPSEPASNNVSVNLLTQTLNNRT